MSAFHPVFAASGGALLESEIIRLAALLADPGGGSAPLRAKLALRIELAQETRLLVLTSAGMSDHEKHLARFCSAGQGVTFSRDNARLGIARDAEYRVVGTGLDNAGRQVVRLSMSMAAR